MEETLTVSFTGPPVVLMRKTMSVAVKVLMKPPAPSRFTLPAVASPAKPVDFRMKPPSASSTCTVIPTAVRFTATSVAPILIKSLVAPVDFCSNPKSPVTVRLPRVPPTASVKLTSSPVSLRYGPAGTSKLIVVALSV